MLRHFDHARALNRASLFGDVGEADAAATAMEQEDPIPGLSSSDQPYLRAFRTAVGAVHQARTREDLGPRAAEVALRCGDCHLASGLGPSFSVDRPDTASDLRDHMRVHDWALSRMWEGLIGGSELSWRAGARTLSGQLLRQDLYASRVEDLDAATAFTEDIHALGVRALSTRTREEKAELLGELWTTCAGCHQLAGVS